MILFGKPVFADMSTDWYKEVLYKYECDDPYGNKYESGSFSYDTPTQLAGINNRRRAIMDVCCQEYRDIATHEFEKILALGAQGWLFDEVMQHNGVMYNFSNDHGYDAPGYLFNGDIPLVKQFRAAADKVNPDFLFSGEGPGDWLMPYYVLGYYRIGWGTRHALRYIDPQAPLMAAVRGWDARDEVNCAMLYRYILEYEPYNFKGSITAFPLTLEYGKKVDALRRKYKAWIWDAEFRDNLGADVTADGSVRYTVYRKARRQARRDDRQPRTEDKPIMAKLELPNAGTLVAATPEEPGREVGLGNAAHSCALGGCGDGAVARNCSKTRRPTLCRFAAEGGAAGILDVADAQITRSSDPWAEFNLSGRDDDLRWRDLGFSRLCTGLESRSSPAVLVDCTMTCARPLKSERLRLLVALLAVGIAVADADERAFACDFEADQSCRGRHGPAFLVERFDLEDGNVFAVGVDLGAVGGEPDGHGWRRWSRASP